MKIKFTPEEVIEFGRELGDIWLDTLTPAERLAGLKPEEQLIGLTPAERLAGLKPEEIEDYLKQLKNVNDK